MLAKRLREYRENQGLSQCALAASINLSVRTIQRVESGRISPRGHTLRVLCNVLGLEITDLADQKTVPSLPSPDSLERLKFLNLSALCFIGVPFGNIILPFLLWRKYKSDPFINRIGRKVINVQLYWSLLLMFLLILAPFLQHLFPTSIVLILWVALLMGILNVVVIIWISVSFINMDYDVIDFRFSLL